jgi:hypothetical protein
LGKNFVIGDDPFIPLSFPLVAVIARAHVAAVRRIEYVAYEDFFVEVLEEFSVFTRVMGNAHFSAPTRATAGTSGPSMVDQNEVLKFRHLINWIDHDADFDPRSEGDFPSPLPILPATLYRRLRREGTNYTELIAAVRKALAYKKSVKDCRLHR